MRRLLPLALAACAGLISLPARAQLADSAPPTVRSRWDATLYGFVDFDMISDSTQSFGEVAGNSAVARPDAYAGQHGRMTFSVRNSRLGLRVAAPETHRIRASAIAEMDFLGNQPTTATEAAVFSNPTFRVRHFALKLETPWFDVLAGQYWELFAWQPYFQPNTVQIQGLPGEVFARTPQLRLSRMFKTRHVSVEVAVAAVRPPSRDGNAPDGQAGLRILANDWRGVRTIGATGTQLDALSVGVSGTARRFVVPELEATPKASHAALGWGVSVDAFVPVIPRPLTNRRNALTLTGSFVRGQGIADLFTSLTGGVAFPAPPNPTGATPVPTYTSNIDNGLVTYGPDGALHTVGWRVLTGGGQYYLPFTGKLWLAAHYSHVLMTNPTEIGAYGSAKMFTRSQFADGNLFWEVTPAVRCGLEYAWFQQTYGDGARAHNHRVQLSGFYIF